jgi:N-acyl-D-amino-acid deacylase
MCFRPLILSGGILIQFLCGAIQFGANPPQAAGESSFEVLIRGGQLYDGTGQPPRRADVGIKDDRIVFVGPASDNAKATVIVDAKGLAVAPGFINMLSWSTDSLLADGRGQSEIRQGVTTQIMGEGWSWGPVNEAIKKRMKSAQTDIKYEIEWKTLSEYLYFLERKGVSHNVASFLGATTVREYVLGHENRKPPAAEFDQMRRLVELEMRDGALGIATALEYSPAYFADTEELIELCKVAARYQGKYITHMRSEGERLLEGIDEVIRISREAKIPAEIYHLKAAGKANWPKMDAAIAKIESARKEGLAITANMYCYTAGAAPLTACIPPWAMEGGEIAMRRRLREPESRQRVLDDIRHRTDWPNFYRNAGSPDNLVLISFKRDTLKPLQGKTLTQIAKERNRDPEETLLDLLLEDESSIGTAYFITAEENIRKLIPLPWISFGSDEASQAPEGVFLKSMPHPRAYGNFARILGKYVREEKLLSLEEAIRKMTSLPAANLGLDQRGLLREGYFADVVVFDPRTIIDRATYEKPHQYAVGVHHVFINGVQVLKNGEHTGAKPGRALWGPGKSSPRPPRGRGAGGEGGGSATTISVLIVTELGDIEVELEAEKAPATVANFLRYVDGKFYDGGRFHRTVKPDNQPDNLVKIEVIQAGINPEKSKSEFPPIKLERTRDTKLAHKGGTISMARSGPDTATSDFFICIGDQPELDFGGKRNPDGQGFAAFGRVTKGMDVVKKIQSAPAEGQKLTPPVKIVRIARK